MAFDSIPARLQRHGRERPDATAYLIERRGQWHRTSWGRYAEQVRTVARALRALGVGEGGVVCILGFNRPEWVLADHAAMAIGAVPAGIYTTCSAEEVGYIVRHSQASVVVVEDVGQLRKVLSERATLPDLRRIVLMEGAAIPADLEADEAAWVLEWAPFLALAAGVEESQIWQAIDGLQPDALATLIYTSGTTGPPKGVMLSHRNLAWTAQLAGQVVDIAPHDRIVSYLPLSHIAEQVFTIHGPATYGNEVWFASSIETVADTFKQANPTILFAVPRIWEKMYAGITGKLRSASPLKLRLFGWASSVGRAAADCENAGLPMPTALRLQFKLADKLIFSKVKAAIGLGACRFAISGAAPISPEVLIFLAGIGVVVREVYGQSEDTGPTSFNRPGRTRFGSVGPAIPGVEVVIAGDGEILVRGPNVFLGYYRDDKATAETLDADGTLHSGDLGSFDADGYLHITGRKKEILITSGGKNIAPKNIEAALKDHPLVGEAVVIGDRRHFLTALLWLEPEAAAAKAKAVGVEPAALANHPEVTRALQEAVDACNARFARVEHVRKFTALPGMLSVEAGELTPTLKVKRRVVAEHFAAEIEAMYSSNTDAPS